MGDVDLVARSLAEETVETFDRRVDEQAARLTEALEAGRLDSPGFALGIELETYAVDERGRLAPIPDRVFESPGERELGVHNLELHTDPDPFDADGIAAQVEALRSRYDAVQAAASDAGLEIVLDAMWTRPPADGTRSYLGDVETRGVPDAETSSDREGVTAATNMTASPRYYAIDNHVLDNAGGSIPLSVPGVETAFPSILYESLTSSIQPHLQIPDTAAFPRYYNVAIRTLGPVLALATNSPLLPTDLYDVADAAGGTTAGRRRDDGSTDAGESVPTDATGAGATDDGGDVTTDASGDLSDPYRLLDATHHELRIPVFEQSVNRGWRKVRVPEDVADATDTVDALVADPACAPFLREWVAEGDRDGLPGTFWELDHKRGTYWRWLRAVAGGQPVGGGDRWSLRIEYRPVPTQPTVAENVGIQLLVAGLVRGLVAADHPLTTLEWSAARRSFYAAVEDGLEADLAWVTADGERTSDHATIYAELFEHARRGLREQGVSGTTIDDYLGSIERRWTQRTTPSQWKLDRVRARLDAGDSFVDAVHAMQADYVERSGIGNPVVDWG